MPDLPPREARPLTPKQVAFVREYLIDLNATQAAIRAGYSARNASEQGYKLVQKSSVQAAIQQAVVARSERTGITQDRVLQEYARIAFTDLREAVSWTESGMSLMPSASLEPDVAAAIKEVRVVKTITRGKDDYEQERVEQRIQMHDKKGALDSVARHLGMFVDRVEQGGSVEIVVRQRRG